MMINAKTTLSKLIINPSKRYYDKRLSSHVKRRLFTQKIGNFVVSLMKYILLFGLAFIILYPLIQQLAVAIRAPGDINTPTILWIPSEFSWKNFEVTMIVLDFWNALKVSVTMSFFVMILQVISTALAGYALARLKFRGSGIVFALVIFTIIVPQTTIELPLKLSLANFLGSNVSLLGNPMVLYLFAGLGMGIRSGIFIFLFRQFFRNIPVELEEAAYVDGANPFQVFIRVMLPNAKGVILIVSILAFVWQWNDTYFTGAFVSRVDVTLETLMTKMMGIRGNMQAAISQAGITSLLDQDVTKNPLFTSMILNTAGILVMLPLLILYVLLQKYLFREGVERSGIVG